MSRPVVVRLLGARLSPNRPPHPHLGLQDHAQWTIAITAVLRHLSARATLSELQAAERRYAMLICMTVDFAESLMPYGCVCHLLPMEIAWGVYWRQQGAFHGVDCEGMMGWLHRRTNKFLACAVTEGEMGSTGMAYFTERLMGEPLQPDGRA